MGKRYWISFVSVLIVLLSGCEKPKTWVTPFNYANYGCVDSCHVKQIKQSIYDAKKKLTEFRILEFNTDGNLTRDLIVKGEDTLTNIVYYYNQKKLADIVTSDDQTSRLVYDKEGHLSEIDYYEKWGGKNTLSNRMLANYDADGRVVMLGYYKQAVGYLPDSDVEDMGGLREIWYSYRDGIRTSYTVNIEDYNTSKRQKLEFTCDERGLLTEMNDIDPVSGNVLRTVKSTYTNDSEGNWIERTDREKKKLVRTVKRELTYYSDGELAAVISPVYSYESGYQEGNSRLANYLADVKNRIKYMSLEYDGGTVLLIIVLTLTAAGMIYMLIRMIKRPFFRRRVQSNGMSRMWMYDSSRYLNVISYFGISLGCFIASILLIALVGGIAWLLAWIIKIIFIIIIVVGGLLTLAGVIGIIGRSEIAAFIVPGALILAFENTLKRWGENLVNWAFDFLQRVNMIGWGYHFFVNLWDVILFVFLTPIAIFLLVALVVILLTSMLNGLEWVITRLYSIRRPCPVCGSTQTPNYMIGGKPHPVKLQPGTYGIFHHVSPDTGQKVPTMLLNGKGKLTRECSRCHAIINSDSVRSFGTEIHIGVVGPRSSGKSYLLYSGLDCLMKSHPENIKQVDADQDTRIDSKILRIKSRQGIQTNDANRYRAVQLMVLTKMRPVPYHLFFYDVAGEKFNSASSSYKTAMDFYKNVQSIIFIIDPSMIDYTGIPASEKIKRWAQEIRAGQSEVYRIDNAFSVLKDILENVGRKSKKIDFSFVCTKADMGYFEADGFSRGNLTEQSIEQFVRTSLGLGNLVNSATASFNRIHFYEISVTDGDNTKLRELFESITEQQGVNY